MEKEISSPTKSGKGREDPKRTSPERNRRTPSNMSFLKRQNAPPALRLVSPIDSDQELNDLEVASVLESGRQQEQYCTSPSKSKRHETPFRPTTVITNLQRGNVQTTTPLFKNMTLHQMAAQGELVLLQQEIADGADVNKYDDGGLTALLWACANGQQSTMEYLISSGADVNASGCHGENSLLLASYNGFTDIARQLLKYGLDVDYVDESGSTSLMYAAYKNNADVVKLLLEHGADMTIQNEDHLTAMDLAVGQGNKQVQQTMERHMLMLFKDLT